MRPARRLSDVVGACFLAALVMAPLAAAPSRGVVGGEPAPEGAHRFMASIQDPDGLAYCGGSVIAPTWVLTAGHCAADVDPEDLIVVTGRRNLDDEHVGQRLQVAQVLVHPGFSREPGPTNLRYDVALLRLAEPTVSPAIALAAPADDAFEAGGTPVKVAGWGDTVPTGGLTLSRELHEAEVNVVSDTECGQRYFNFDPDSHVCAAALLKGSCNGDSGGPLFAAGSRGPVQVGVVSFGQYPCVVPTFPGVYSEVNNSTIRDWIASKSNV